MNCVRVLQGHTAEVLDIDVSALINNEMMPYKDEGIV